MWIVGIVILSIVLTIKFIIWIIKTVFKTAVSFTKTPIITTILSLVVISIVGFLTFGPQIVLYIQREPRSINIGIGIIVCILAFAIVFKIIKVIVEKVRDRKRAKEFLRNC